MSNSPPIVLRAPRYPDISARAFQHPADRAATSALGSIPVIHQVIKRLSGLSFERSLTQQLLGNAVRLGPSQAPAVWTEYLSCLEALDIASRPCLYAIQTPTLNAMTFGSVKPVVMLQSGLVTALDTEALKAVLAHEVGHVLAEHSHYMTVLMILQALARAPLSVVGELPVRALLLVMLEWYRAAELTGDRASALVMGDPMITCRALMHMAGGSLPGMSVDAFVAQAHEYASSDDVLSRPSRFLSEISSTHPFPVRRVTELTRWVMEGDFDRIRSGSYTRRGAEPPPSEDFKVAAQHYQARFVEIIESVAGGVQTVSRQVTSWLRSQGARFARDDNGDGPGTEQH
ncbi:MAG: M48 family metallopeptidase [Acidimicrobiales bacterium]